MIMFESDFDELPVKSFDSVVVSDKTDKSFYSEDETVVATSSDALPSDIFTGAAAYQVVDASAYSDKLDTLINQQQAIISFCAFFAVVVVLIYVYKFFRIFI